MDLGISIITILFVINFVRLLFLVLELFPLELLYQESTLSSGMLRVDEITLFVLLGVDVTWQIQHVISFLIFYLLGVPRPLGFPFEFSLVQGQGFSRCGWLSFTLLLPTRISTSGVLGD